ncbi:hypothetical protein C8R47DRAFT_1078323 [Mycena vitilis]|nr:hypothetical protein C8R47DRAFT_1078323 [Mycena vitilis]
MLGRVRRGSFLGQMPKPNTLGGWSGDEAQQIEKSRKKEADRGLIELHASFGLPWLFSVSSSIPPLGLSLSLPTPGVSGFMSSTSREYSCDCPRYCKRPTPVSKATYYSHAPYRPRQETLSRALEQPAALLGHFTGVQDRAAPQIPDNLQPPRKRQKLSLDRDSDSESASSDGGDGGLASMQLSDDPPPFAVGDSDGFGQTLEDKDDIADPGSIANPQDDLDGPATPPVLTPPESPRPESPPPPAIILHDPPPPLPASIHEKLSKVEDPDNYAVAGCDHPDVSGRNLAPDTSDKYLRALFCVMEAKSENEHAKLRLETGVSKPALFSALPRTIPVPGCYAMDIMHLIINIFDLFLGLWRGTLECDAADHIEKWPWAVLTGETWKNHGKDVENARPYLPGSFDRPPRNIAEKISSGYKAQEQLTYFFALGPGLLYGLLPDVHWRNYCKIVRGYRIIYQRKIPREELLESYKLFMEGVEEFEQIYYQRMTSRIHFCRQSIHQLFHLPFEPTRVGPGAYYSQFTMERTIGNLGQELKQHSTPYANLSQRGCRRAQVNSLKSMIPDLEPVEKLPRGSEDLGDGYVLLRAKDEYNQVIHGAQGDAIQDYLEAVTGEASPANFRPSLQRWARLRLPNGQIARCAWKEKQKALNKVRMSRNVQFLDASDEERYGEIQFFFQAEVEEEILTLALIDPYSAPDHDLLEASYKTLWVCEQLDDTDLEVVEVNSISSVVGMVPFDEDRVFVVHKMGLEIGSMGGVEEDDAEIASKLWFRTRPYEARDRIRKAVHRLAGSFFPLPRRPVCPGAPAMNPTWEPDLSPLMLTRNIASLDFQRPSPAPSSLSNTSSRYDSRLAASSTVVSPELSNHPLTSSESFTPQTRRTSIDSFDSSGEDFWSKNPRGRPAVPTMPWNPSIADATHQQLVDNRNLQYLKLQDANTQLHEHVEKITVAYNQLNAKYDTLSTAYSLLVDKVADRLSAPPPAHSPQSSVLPISSSDSKEHLRVLEKEQYPKINYWTEEEYLKEAQRRKKDKGLASMSDAQAQRGSRRLLVDDTNVMLWFVEDSEGSTTSGTTLKQARNLARHIWAYLDTLGLAPARWNDSTSLARDYYVSEMRLKFPELRYCALDYKSHRIATAIYPGWRSSRSKNPKDEPSVLEDLAAETISSGTKRDATEPAIDEPLPKKQKTRAKKSKSKAEVPAPVQTGEDPVTASLGTESASPVVAPPAPSPIAAPTSNNDPITQPPSGNSIHQNAVASSSAAQSSANGLLALASAAAATAPAPPTPTITQAVPVTATSVVDDPLLASQRVSAALGASVGPNTRSDFVQKTVEKREAKKGKAKAKKSVSAAPADETAPAPANKVIYLRPSNTSKSARTIGKVTKADFDAHYRGLPAETLKCSVVAHMDISPSGAENSFPSLSWSLSLLFMSAFSPPCTLGIGSMETDRAAWGGAGQNPADGAKRGGSMILDWCRDGSREVQIGEEKRETAKFLDLPLFGSIFLAGILTGDEEWIRNTADLG